MPVGSCREMRWASESNFTGEREREARSAEGPVERSWCPMGRTTSRGGALLIAGKACLVRAGNPW